MDSVENQIIGLQVSKEVTTLFKFYLELLEQLHLSEEQHTLFRKQILNHGNDTIRNLIQFLDFFDFTVNPQKIKEASQKRIIFSKTINSPPILV